MTNWTDHVWVIREVLKDPGHVIRKVGAPNEFRLVANDPEVAAYYHVLHEKGAMTDFWAKCRLFPRGTGPSPEWTRPMLSRSQVARTEQWEPEDHEELKRLQQHPDVNSRRLEGDFKVDGAAHAVTLWIVEKMIHDAKIGPLPLLVIDLRAHSMCQSTESGSGTGDPK